MTAGRKDKLTTDILSRLTHVSKDLSLFENPTPEQRKAKERFWAPFLAGDTPVPPTMDLAAALKFAGDRRLKQWWDLPGFQDWFFNREEFKERVEFIAHLALDGIEEVLKDRMATASAKVAAAKLALEVANKLPKAKDQDGRFADDKINQMDRAQLEAFIKRKLTLLPNSTESLTVDLEPGNLNQEPGVHK